MQLNPHLPPTAKVAGDDGAHRPVTVKAAALLLSLSFGIGLLNMAAQGQLLFSSAALLGYTLGAAYIAGTIFAVLSRRNWLRWIVVGLLGLGLIVTPWSVQRLDSTADQAVYVCQAVMQAVALGLMLLTSSSRWYRPNNSSKPTPLRGAA